MISAFTRTPSRYYSMFFCFVVFTQAFVFFTNICKSPQPYTDKGFCRGWSPTVVRIFGNLYMCLQAMDWNWIFLIYAPPCFLRQELSFMKELTNLPGQLDSVLQGPECLCFSSLDWQECTNKPCCCVACESPTHICMLTPQVHFQLNHMPNPM